MADHVDPAAPEPDGQDRLLQFLISTEDIPARYSFARPYGPRGLDVMTARIRGSVLAEEILLRSLRPKKRARNSFQFAAGSRLIRCAGS